MPESCGDKESIEVGVPGFPPDSPGLSDQHLEAAAPSATRGNESADTFRSFRRFRCF